jgi:hypothetical protein
MRKIGKNNGKVNGSNFIINVELLIIKLLMDCPNLHCTILKCKLGYFKLSQQLHKTLMKQFKICLKFLALYFKTE